MRELPSIDHAMYFPNHYVMRMIQKTEYLDEVTPEFICELLGRGHTLTAVANFIHMPMPVVADWLASDPVRVLMLDRAKEIAAQAFVDEATRVLTENIDRPKNAATSRNAADHYKWLAERMAPTQFGTKVAAQVPVAPVVFNIVMGESSKMITIDPTPDKSLPSSVAGAS